MRRIAIFLLLNLSVFAIAQTAQNADFKQEGIASWYGTEFAGRPTASGEIFDPRQLSAAHPSLPFGTLLRITNTQNEKTVAVKVNDRGPFVAARIIDVSEAAAELLDMIVTGTAPVRIEIINSPYVTPAPQVTQKPPTVTAQPVTSVQPAAAEPPTVTARPVTSVQPAANVPQTPLAPQVTYVAEAAPATPPDAIPARTEAVSKRETPAAITPQLPPPGTNKTYRLQVGSYRLEGNAIAAFNRLKTAGLNPSYEKHGEFSRVVVAGIKPEEIESLAGIIGNAGFVEVLVREER